MEFKLRRALAAYLLMGLLPFPTLLRGQNGNSAAPNEDTTAPLTKREKELLERIENLEQRIGALEAQPTSAAAPSQPSAVAGSGKGAQGAGAEASLSPSSPATNAPSSKTNPLAFTDGTTLNFSLDGYYGYNFNHPVGRVNHLRANDPLSDSFSLNQAVVMIERTPDVDADRRFGYRLDLMFGATN
jgi:hypothetical protein